MIAATSVIAEYLIRLKYFSRSGRWSVRTVFARRRPTSPARRPGDPYE
jgi:hypothetical protein